MKLTGSFRRELTCRALDRNGVFWSGAAGAEFRILVASGHWLTAKLGLHNLMIWLAFLFATDSPTASDVRALEELRVLEPRSDIAKDGRRFVEFAPAVETRNLTCSSLSKRVYRCAYETRVKEMFDRDFGQWEARSEKLERQRGGWRRVT